MGIILICLAVFCLGLSGTVSAVYFAFCSRKTKSALTPVASNRQTQPHEGPVTGAVPGRRPEPAAPLKSVKPPVARKQFLYRRKYPGLYKNRKDVTGLSTHAEEDSEVTKSPVDLYEAKTNSSSRTSGECVGKEGEESVADNSAVYHLPSKAQPSRDAVSHLGASAHSSDDVLETELPGRGSLFIDGISCSDSYSEAASTRQLSLHEDTDASLTVESFDRLRHSEIFGRRSCQDYDLLPPLELPYNVDVSCHSVPEHASSSSSSSVRQNIRLQVLNVRPVTLPSPSTSRDMEEADDCILDLPSTLSHQSEHRSTQVDMYTPDSWSESRSSFNSYFSFDRNDPTNRVRSEGLLENDSHESNL